MSPAPAAAGTMMQNPQLRQVVTHRAIPQAGRQWATAEQLDEVLNLLDDMWSRARGLGILRLKPTQLGIELRRVAVAARSANVLPEHFLWIIKETWSALPEVRSAEPDRARDQLSGIITLCIHEYYRD